MDLLIIDKLKQLATEVMALLQKETGTTEYVRVYQSVHEHIIEQRRERRNQRVIQAVADPKARALERMKKTAAKQSARKRKAQEFSSRKIKQSHSTKLKLH